MRLDPVIPFSLEIIALDGHCGKLFIGDFDAGFICVLVKLGANAKA